MKGHGQSRATRQKLFVLEGIINARLAKLAKLHWLTELWLIDLNAGSGWNDRTGETEPIRGTPLIGAAAISDIGVNIKHVLIDIDPANCADLRQISDLRSATVECSDNAKWLAGFAPSRSSGGLIVSDPNGPADLPYEQLREFASRFRYFDYIINHNLTAAQRCRGVSVGSTKFAPGMARYVPLADKATAIRQFGKDHALVARENVAKRTVWFIFVATNDPTLKALPRFGLYHVESPQGRSLIGEFEGAQLELFR